PPAVFDNCGSLVTPPAPIVSADPACAGTKTYTYTYADCDGDAYNWVYTYTIAPPTVTLPAPGVSTVACVANAVAPTPPTVTDNCGKVLTPSAPVVSADPVCAGTKTYAYTYTACNGVAYNWTYTYTIAPPTVTLPAPGASTVSCVANAVAPTPPTVTDNCGRVLSPSAPIVSADPVCAGIKTYTYTYTACNGVAYNWIYTYIITPQPQTLVCPPAQTLCESASGNYVIPAIVTSNNCDIPSVTTFEISGATVRNGTVNDASGSYNTGVSIITWTISSACGAVTCVTTVNVLPIIFGEETITICESALPYAWNNQSITAAGNYTATLASVTGCDSIATLHLLVNPIVNGQETITICESALPYAWNNQTITVAGNYTATLASVTGCDSIATLHLLVNPIVNGQETITICESALP